MEGTEPRQQSFDLQRRGWFEYEQESRVTMGYVICCVGRGGKYKQHHRRSGTPCVALRAKSRFRQSRVGMCR